MLVPRRLSHYKCVINNSNAHNCYYNLNHSACLHPWLLIENKSQSPEDCYIVYSTYAINIFNTHPQPIYSEAVIMKGTPKYPKWTWFVCRPQSVLCCCPEVCWAIPVILIYSTTLTIRNAGGLWIWIPGQYRLNKRTLVRINVRL